MREPAQLSFGQERLWFLTELGFNRSAYNLPTALRLEGALDFEALRKAVDTIVSRHEILRSTFQYMGGQLRQIVNGTADTKFTVIDLTGVGDYEREAEMQRQIAQIAAQPFDLTREQPLRAALIALASTEHVLLIVTHNIASDDWSRNILFSELCTLYEAFSVGASSPLPELRLQYADYAEWQRLRYLRGLPLAGLSYWKKQLAGLSALELPVNHRRPAVQSFHGSNQSKTLPEPLADQLNKLCREEQISHSIFLLTAWQILLWRYSAQEDIAIGFSVDGRTRTDLQGLIGFIEDTVILRADLSGNPTFRELLARTCKVVDEACEHKDVPFEKLADELQIDHDLSRHPLFQVKFTDWGLSEQFIALRRLTMSPLRINTNIAKVDLNLLMFNDADGLKVSLQYNTDLFDDDMIVRMLCHFENLLNGIALNPDHQVSDFVILTELEKQHLLVELNDTTSDYPKNMCIHDLFEAQAENAPDRIAVVSGSHKISYGELNRRANQLARYLRTLGVGPDSPVGITVERSIESIIGLVGILKAGGAYVPLDPSYPKDRLAYMMASSQATVLLTFQELVPDLRAPEVQVVFLDGQRERIALESGKNLARTATAENLAYIIFTSGSTGTPKGVSMSHRPLVNLIVWHNENLPLLAGERVVQFAPCSFDVSFQEIFSTFCCGNTLVLVTEGVRRDPRRFVQFLSNAKINRLFIPPVVLHQLAQAHEENSSPELHLREIITAGEQLTITPQVVRLFHHLRECSLNNHYGPTESHVVTTFQIPLRPADWPAQPPIGRPIANSKIYVLDQHQQPVPIGVAGELYIGGVTLAKGYVNRPDLTVEKFLVNPFVEATNARMYKTGDLARYLPDGKIEYLGRIDHQVKIRGFRVELGEVETILSGHAKVRQAAVLAHDDQANNKRLVAYVVLDGEEDESAADLRSFLKSKLPDYMVPSDFVFLDSMPISPNGKVDRRALRAPERKRSASEASFVPPRDQVESKLVAIWQNVLGVEPIGVRDNFFDIGGHSLLAVGLIREMEKAFGRSLQLTTLFHSPTVEQFSRLLNETQPTSSSSLVPIQPNGNKPPFFWVHGETSDVFLPRYLASDQPLYGFVHQGQNGERARLTTVEDIAAHYLNELRRVQPEGPYFLGGYCFGGLVALEMAQRLKGMNEEVERLVLLEPDDLVHCQGFRLRIASPVENLTISQFLREKLRRHSQILNLLSFRAKLTHILRRVKGTLNRLISNMVSPVRKAIQSAVCRVFFGLGYPLPIRLRSTHVLQVYNNATRNYHLRTYSGPVIIFMRADLADVDRSNWNELFPGHLKIYSVPGNHTDILNEPHLKVWAELLNRALLGNNILSALLMWLQLNDEGFSLLMI
jgi:amino acid adenylation domain-containing protein